jgi:hypothetical protein
VGRRRISKPPNDTPALCRRFEWLLQHEFANSITVMAAALGASHAALSRVINHGQLPGATMIEALARSGRVNLDWLLAGDADEPPARGPATSSFLPVSDRLLPGPPGASPEALGHLGLPTASPFALGDGYWFRVPSDSPLVARDAEEVAPGDYLLITAGPAWVGREEAYVGRIVVLRHPARQEGMLARVGDEDFFADTHAYELDTFGLFADALLITATRSTDAKPKPSSRSTPKGGQQFHVGDVVGVVVEKRTLYPRTRV